MNILITFISGYVELAIKALIVCAIATPFIKRLINYAIDKYRMEGNA